MDRNQLVGSKSIFRLPISNTLGINALESRAKLKDFALQYPAQYSKLRNQVYLSVVKTMVEDAHKTLWDLLSSGILPDKSHIQVQRENWSPNLPDQEIGKLANGFAESIMTAFESIMSKVLPDDYKTLADEKMINISKVTGVLNAGASA